MLKKKKLFIFKAVYSQSHLLFFFSLVISFLICISLSLSFFLPFLICFMSSSLTGRRGKTTCLSGSNHYPLPIHLPLHLVRHIRANDGIHDVLSHFSYSRYYSPLPYALPVVHTQDTITFFANSLSPRPPSPVGIPARAAPRSRPPARATRPTPPPAAGI